MSLPPQLGGSSAFYIGDDGGEVDHQELMLETANSLASQDCLKESTDWLSMAVRYGPVRPEQLSTFVDCIVRNFKRKTPGCEAAAATTQGGEPANFSLDCPNCLGFLSDPVTLACGHSYCRRCLQRRLLSKCKVCSEPVRGGEKASVVLCGLLHKWFPEDAKKSKTLFQIDELGRKKQYEAAIALATDVAQSDPHLSEMARLSRAESYLALKQYGLALEDSDVSPHSTCSAEAFYWKAMVLHDMGQVDESLQVFLHSLALNDDFPCAKWQVAKIICDLLSLANESVTVGLRETTQSTSPRLRSKTLVADAQMSPQKHNEEAPQHETRAALPHGLSNPTLKRRCESVERHGLSRAHSLRSPGSGFGEECLKRVCSAPQLGDQEKASLLKRKLSDAEPCVVDSWGGKPKKQGLTSRQDAATTKRIIPEHLLDPNDLECSLCMRLLYEPVTTPCGHTFCKNCLERCLDHTAQCPLCKESLKEYLAGRRYVITSVLDTLIKEHLRQEHAERATVHLEETREFSDLTRNVPIFVCTMAYPTVPCPLHVFEPRYRLMIRRCMDTSTQQFGMCIQDPQKGFADYGCMLFIRSVHFLPDGRSVVDTVGGKRFRVLTRGMRDGYSIADIEHLEDTKVEDGEELKSLQQLHDAVYEQARVWFQNLKIRFHNQILQHFGPMPGREDDIQATVNGPACCWWLLAVLPIDPRYQLSVLSMTSLRERLEKIQQILTYLQSIPNN